MLLLLSNRTERLYAVLLLGVVVAAVRASMPGKDTPLPDLDEQIDYLSSVIAKQDVSDVRQSGSSESLSQPLPKSASHSSTVKAVTHSPSTTTRRTSKPPVAQTKAPGRIKHVSPTFLEDGLIVLMMSAFIILGTVALIMAAVCWFRIQRESHLTQKVDYPAFHAAGSSSASVASTGDKKLAHSAQMYHYQHQKQQMLSMEKHKVEPKVSEPGVISDEETEEGDFTVYECPGLAPTGEMEVKNPLFDDSTLQNGRNHK
ncbi:neural proliferation differentiation and control protein 1a isoform X2 [Ictalurus punctatus]|uniref:Neural proliferation differentiation and control protein 1a isoform X2 n=1 Tax=Ictalurus punctatus TaxID=7998 RepID=A0A2D0T1D3_ICTPU|nr:neural proliferation differentiation and control protein 1a isoform X2 [Ictalurus punctatus]